jgi:sugar lactone lactonase YvrE
MKLTTGRLACLFSVWLVFAGVGRAAEQADLPPTNSVEPELYATGFEFAEGPALNPVTGDLFVVNYRENGTIGRIKAAPDGTAGILCDLREAEPLDGRQSRANGLKIDGEGRLIVADIGVGRILRISADGKSAEVLADRCEGKRFNAINDVALDRKGNIYFSDPGGSSVKKAIGSIYRYDIETTNVTRLATGLAYPNGLAVTPDGRHLCVAESQRYRILIFDLSEKGDLTNRRVLIDFPTETRGQIIGGATPPDGMIFDAAGRLYVAMSTGGVINVVEVPSGELIRQYKAGGDRATNCHFHGGYLYVTVAAKEAVFRLKLGVEGHDYAGSRKGE